MLTTHAVIGSNFGDEGKGLVVNHLCENSDKYNTVVVRSQSGPQAAHTVWKDNRYHVCSHYGAGTLQNIPTYFDQGFIVNPISWFLEKTELYNTFGIEQSNKYSVFCKVSTPFDVYRNRLTEHIRSEDSRRHGSCGMGIFESILRGRVDTKLKIYAGTKSNALYRDDHIDYFLEWYLRTVPKAISNGAYIPKELRDIDKQKALQMWDSFTRMLTTFQEYNELVQSGTEIPITTNTIIFEIGQGLGLDMKNLKNFPYLTPSHTDLTSVKICSERLPKSFTNSQNILHLVTRSYLTRHGAGPFTDILDIPKEWSLKDSTNNTNAYQGKVRISRICIREFIERIAPIIHEKWHSRIVLHINFLDQTNWVIPTEDYGDILPETFRQLLLKEFGNELPLNLALHETNPNCITPI